MGKVAGSAARALLDEELEGADEIVAAAWQREQALDTWAKMKAGDRSEVSKADIDADFDAALEQLGARTG